MGRVIVIGSINQDITVTVERFAEPGETLSGSGVAYTLGGKGANLGELIAAGLPVPGGFCVTADASFAGQQQTILGVVGADAVLEAIRQCWASPEQPRASPTART